jgi:hypothetical protein
MPSAGPDQVWEEQEVRNVMPVGDVEVKPLTVEFDSLDFQRQIA